MQHKPKLLVERTFYQQSTRESACFLAYGLALYLLPVAAMMGIDASEAPGWAVGLASVPLTCTAGYGLFLLGTTAHEGFHFNLSARRELSCCIGCVFSSLLPGFCATGYFVAHWQHHRHNNADCDPDYVHFERFRTVFGRLLLARLTLTANYLVDTVRIALPGYRPSASLPLPTRALQWLARFNLLCQAGWLVAYGVLLASAPATAMILAPVLGATLLIGSFNSYQEHAFRPVAGEPFARSRTSRVLTWLHAGSNYHVEHHLYPSVPCWRLPSVHRRLVASGWYDDKQYLLDRSLVGTFKYCFADYRYGGK